MLCLSSCQGQGPPGKQRLFIGRQPPSMPGVRGWMKPCTPGVQPVTDRNDAKRARKSLCREQRSRRGSADSPVLPAWMPRWAFARQRFHAVHMPERVATTTEAPMTKSTGKSSSAIDATDTLATKAKRVVSMAA